MPIDLEIYKTVFNNSPVGITIRNLDGYYIEVNQAFLNLVGYNKQEIIGKSYKEIIQKEYRDISVRKLEAISKAKLENISFEQGFKNKDKSKVYVKINVSYIKDSNGKEFFLSQIINITELKELNLELEKKNKKLNKLNRILEHKSITDFLTKTYNRNFIMNIIEGEIKRSKRSKEKLSMILFDIDFFKNINDNYGHLIGDKVLVEISAKTKEVIRDVDILGRYGGEEFIVILPNTEKKMAFEVAERIRKGIKDLIFVEDLRVTVSLGIAEYKNGIVNNLIEAADKKLYYAKQSGRDRSEF